MSDVYLFPDEDPDWAPAETTPPDDTLQVDAYLEDLPLFEMDRQAITLADKFIMPPMTILDRRTGHWQARRRRWLNLGIESEVGRDVGLIWKDSTTSEVTHKIHELNGGTSVFDPVICEMVYRWWSGLGARVLDPFAGGSVRGVVASALRRRYTGIELRPEQVDANRRQAHLGMSDEPPTWILGDATAIDDYFGPQDRFDLIFSCPPYHDLEVYSDDPRDLSNMGWESFRQAHRTAISKACARLRDNRFAAWVISDVRSPRGVYRGLVGETVEAFRGAGLDFLNDAIIVDPYGTAPLRAEKSFRTTRKLTRSHQHLLVFVKGDPKEATKWATT